MENLITRGGSWIWTEIPSSSEQGLTLLVETMSVRLVIMLFAAGGPLPVMQLLVSC